MKKISFLMLSMALAGLSVSAKQYELLSPNGDIKTVIDVNKTITYSVSKGENLIIEPSQIAMQLGDGKILGENASVKSTKKIKVNESFKTPVYKKSSVNDVCNELNLSFNGGYKIVFRAYDDGVAYRFVTDKKGEMIVENETAEFNFPTDNNSYAAYSNVSNFDSFTTQYPCSFENTYDVKKMSELNSKRLIFLPFLTQCASGETVVVTESDLSDYPGMFLTSNGKTMKAEFAPVVKEQKLGGHNNLQQKAVSRESFIAKTSGKRSFPWRIIIVADEPKELLSSDMVYKLASRCKIEDASWITPGKVAWDWWNDWNISGVDFRAGVNNDTYKFYIDFASKNNIKYVILDEGWATNGKCDLFDVIPSIDLKEIVDYGKSKNVDIILWAGYWAYAKDMENITKHYSDMGVKGFKIDFMDRDDQEIISFLEKTAQVCAKYKMLVDFHGTSKPAGLQATWPNVINFEGVSGLEQMKWQPKTYDQVKYDLEIPFIRMVAGPMDYTQGAMRNANKKNYNPVNSEPMSQGTRCRQLATYIVFDSPLNMLCDAPTNYMKEQECTDFIAAVPTVWDETKPLDGEISKYVAVAKRSGNDWYVGAMTDWNKREMVLDLSYLENGNYEIEIFKDGINADRAACDYKKEVVKLPADKKLNITMQPGGGFAAKIYKK
ncbi:MAG: glycoside hydrolase family 97 protein [Bacteroidales bacterium]|nr:glycoside hydrolase family 97 protein [Bacteroidales bacterium]